jgi:hypothetical protein
MSSSSLTRVYRNIRFTFDRGHPLQVPCGGKAQFWVERWVFADASKYLFSSSRQWEFGNPKVVSKECGEGWKAGFLAFLAFYPLSFQRPALESPIKRSQSTRRPDLGSRINCPGCRRSNPGADYPGVERLSTPPRRSQEKPARAQSVTGTRAGPSDAKSLSETRAPLGHQNQPPVGTRPLRRRYVTRLP